MFEIAYMQKMHYGFDKRGIGQVSVLCGSVTLPRVISEEELQRAANEVYRINDGLRSYFIEKDGKVYEDFSPFEEQKFDVLHFKSREELDAWGRVFATIPLKLDIRTEGSGVPKEAWQTGSASPALVKNVMLHHARTKAKCIKHGIKVRPGCCDLRLVVLPDACGAIIKMHHIVSDAWTMMLVANQFVQLLNGEQPTAYHYEEYLQNELAYRSTKRYQRDGEFFKQQYARCSEPTVVWPTPMHSLEATRRTVTLDTTETAAINSYASDRGVSPFIVFLTALSVFVSRKTNRKQLYIGSIVINRTGVRERKTAGLFANSVPLLIEFDDTTTFADAITRVRDENYAAFRHEKGPRANPITSLLYDLWVSYQNASLDADSAATLTQYYCDYAPSLKTFSVEDRSNEGCYKIHFDHSLEVTQAEVDEMFNVVLSAIRDGIADDSKRITELGV